jgi:putative ABC transport system substrate-binding protein
MTRDIPIVFAYVSDAVGSGLVEGLARPAANVTGLTHHNSSLNPKRLDLLHRAVPKAALVAGVWQPGGLGQHTEQLMLQETDAAATALGMRLRLVEARGAGDLDAAFAAAAEAHPDALVVLPAPVFRSNARRVVQLVARGRLPTMYFGREFPEVGGLMSYGADMANILQRAAFYVDRILKGARPSDLPVERGSKFEFVINAKTAKALGLTLAPSLLAGAEVIE